ncbi:Ltp family lipoprotein [Listeria kieliensis]
MEKQKKSIFKKWWFWIIIVLVLGAIGAGTGDKKDEEETVSLSVYSTSIETNKHGVAWIKGETDKKATLRVDGKVTKTKSNGKFSIKIKLSPHEEEKKVAVEAKRSGFKSALRLVTIENAMQQAELSVENNLLDTDENGKAIIKGTAEPHSTVKVDDSPAIEVGADGKFSHEISLDPDEENREVMVKVEKDGYVSAEEEIKIENHSKSYKEKKAKEEAKRKAEEEQARKKEEAERKAEEERAAKEKAEEERKARLGVEGENALSKAEQYSDSMKMSKAAIYDQLVSEYGEQFSAEAAQYAVDNLKADYNENALAKAKEYQESMQMSPAAIRDQLTSQYGEKFTASEADYAIKHLNN